MWEIKNIKATNLCSFRTLDLDVTQGQATLIFGNNTDSESQNSNGSGKSALIEAIAIGLIGEPLRKVNNDEIINDQYDEANVILAMTNQDLGLNMIIKRKLSRTSPQEIIVEEQPAPYDQPYETVKQATVADYNKHILDRLGLTKEDILSNYVLTARKYKSFLSSSDKEKKEIINRFSNGIMVDESLEILRKEIEELDIKTLDSKTKLAEQTGRKDTLVEEIKRLQDELLNNRAEKEEKIQQWRNQIAQRRAEIRFNDDKIKSLEMKLGQLEDLDTRLEGLEKSSADLFSVYSKISGWLCSLGASEITNYEAMLNEKKKNIAKMEQHIQELSDKGKDLASQLNEAKDSYRKFKKDNDEKRETYTEAIKTCREDIEEIGNEIWRTERELNSAVQKSNALLVQTRLLEQSIAGIITCPSCGHEFLLKNNVDIPNVREQIQDISSQKKKVDSYAREINQTITEMGDRKQKLVEKKLRFEDLIETTKKKEEKILEPVSEFTRLARYNTTALNHAKEELTQLTNWIQTMRPRMFDEAFHNLDVYYEQIKAEVESVKQINETAKGTIDSLQSSIEQLKSNNEQAAINAMRTKLEDATNTWKDLSEQVSDLEFDLNELKSQELAFIEFKTYLANARINSIAKVTNEFLESIGSDIRVAYSGYTMLKSGKVRDKISVSLLRDGLDCGSFDKFSAGEKMRVELASVLAMMRLCNINAEDGKGLNLLVIDELLDCTDETGLANVFKALNDLHLTALVVSHGNVQENYPNRLIVTKRNGISTI